MPSRDRADEPVDRGDEAGAENPTSRRTVHDWIAGRVAADEQMRFAGAAARARSHVQEES